MPTVFKIGEHRFFFFSNEGSEPPHIHVEAAGKYAKFWLRPVELADSVAFKRHELTELREIVEERRELLLERWHDFFER